MAAVFITFVPMSVVLNLFQLAAHLVTNNNLTRHLQSVSQILQANFPDGGSVLGWSQFTLLPQLNLKTILGLKVVKINSKLSNLLC
jgi:hypothetical protein